MENKKIKANIIFSLILAGIIIISSAYPVFASFRAGRIIFLRQGQYLTKNNIVFWGEARISGGNVLWAPRLVVIRNGLRYFKKTSSWQINRNGEKIIFHFKVSKNLFLTGGRYRWYFNPFVRNGFGFASPEKTVMPFVSSDSE